MKSRALRMAGGGRENRRGSCHPAVGARARPTIHGAWVERNAGTGRKRKTPQMPCETVPWNLGNIWDRLAGFRRPVKACRRLAALRSLKLRSLRFKDFVAYHAHRRVKRRITVLKNRLPGLTRATSGELLPQTEQFDKHFLESARTLYLSSVTPRSTVLAPDCFLDCPTRRNWSTPLSGWRRVGWLTSALGMARRLGQVPLRLTDRL